MVEVFRDWFEHRHEYAKDWQKRTGGKVLGYFCTYAPEEIMYAAGILPVRVLGGHEPQALTEPHIFGMFCPFCRDCLAQGLKGSYDYLNGIMLSQSCIHLRQTYTSWRIHIPVSYQYYLPFPHGVQNPPAYKYLTNELRAFQKSIEDWAGQEISNEALDQSIEVYNKNRRLLRQIFDLRRGKHPPISGLDAMYLALSSQMVDKAEHNVLLEQFLERLQAGAPSGNGNSHVRLMLIGSENDDTTFVKMVEGLGADIVIDEHCTGTRYFWNEVEPQEDRLAAIAARYIDRPPCPAKDWPMRRRLPHILSLAKDYGVQGAVLIQQKFCDPHEFDMPAIAEALKKEGVPSYNLEFDVTVPLGQFKIRMEAFLEMLRGEELF
ncbi:MAG: benzoyl-CoA reductase, bzd-type, subunit N [Acidobacteria bacterium]|nr:benzoyl-CoA reductase, bzd-type, subunit N [Acidobacteriota bacterium]